ncbi:FAD binding domain protein [Diplogelasinospora grovesii]|uniref:FAD binding domain protein n=1 Tax=Diplogelasinospora grovesii TaxID=303347 RepID=A0AAN6S655_9PEZI|nr:FAD binding domain protein [Diplogelasinospora grovesii]
MAVILLRDSADPSTFQEAVWGRVFNHRRDVSRVPFAFCAARSVSDVVAAVSLAKSRGCRVSVRSGGHSWAGWSVRSDAVLIDLGDLDLTSEIIPVPETKDGGRGGGRGRTVYDEATKIVSCPPSCTGRILNAYLKERGRMFAGGHCPDVGLGGFLLQGGMGWNCKNWGWACESVSSVDVVTADAKVVHCSAVENADLFWAARGSGPGFPGVVVRFHLMTRPLLQMYQSLYFYPITEFKKVLAWEISVAPTADKDTEIVGVSAYTPVPGKDEKELTIMASFLTFKSTREEAELPLKGIHDDPQRPKGAVLEIFAQETSLDNEYYLQASSNPEQHRYCAENAYIVDDGSVDVPAVLEESFSTLPTKKSFALWFSMSPTSKRPIPSPGPTGHYGGGSMALSMQSDHYFALYTVWDKPEDDKRCMSWTHERMKTVERHAVGSYLGDADFQYRRTRFWSTEAGEELMKIRRKWDPEGRICGYLDDGDKSGVDGLANKFEWLALDNK